MRYLRIFFLTLATFGWSQKSASPLIVETDTLDLGQKPISLNEVIVISSNLSALELVMESKKVMMSSSKFEDQERTYFLRHSELNKVDLNLDLKESTIEQIDPNFINQITQSVPKQSSLHTEALYKLTQNDSLGESVRLLRGFELEEESSKIDAENIVEFFIEKIEESLSKGNYFKVKSGIFGGKIEEDDIDLDNLSKKKDSSLTSDTIVRREKHVEASAAGYQRLKELKKYQPYESDPIITVYENPKRFDFQIINYTLFKEQWVHVVAFKEKSKAQFYGELWISEQDKALLQFKFINSKPLKSIKLMGFEYSEPRVQGQFLYKKFNDGNYHHYFGRLEEDTKVSVNRPLSFIEKKKALIGGRKVNRVDLDISFGLSQTEEYTYILAEGNTEEIDNESFDTLEELDSYPTNYWKDGKFKVAPSEAMKNFRKTIQE